MKVHEYQAKALLREFGVPVPRGDVAATPAEARAVADRLGGRVVVKAQVHAGGRGKAGGIKVADDASAAEAAARQILGMRLRTPQTPPEGIAVRRVLVEEASAVATELYLSVTLDRARGAHVVMASRAGGMEIEEVAAAHPELILREWAEPALGLQGFQARALAFGLGLTGDAWKTGAALVQALFRAYLAKDCSLAEINPLVVTEDGRVLALDAKLNIDDSALFRHPEVVALRDVHEEDPLDVEASRHGLNYIKLDGDVGCMVNGAGLAMATMDIIKLAGGQPANFLDVGGGASPEQIENAFRILSSDPSVRAVFINVFGGILRCDRLAEGVIAAVRKLGVTMPVVVRMEGTNVELGRRMLAESGLNFATADDMGAGAATVVALARGEPASSPPPPGHSPTGGRESGGGVGGGGAFR
jgi:succinyl-CoA synthetase beta subunit